jgi:hypothetical protein
MRPKIELYALLIIAAFSLISFRWPVEHGRVTSTFCESRWDHFHDGIDIVSAETRVYPVESGTLLFYWDKALFPLENYPGGGNYKILKHRNGLYSIYMHLESGSPFRTVYTDRDPLGTMGDTGHSLNRHLHFSILNIKERSSINPYTMLPPLPDKMPPEIREIAFKIGDKYVIVRNGANLRLTRNYPLLVRIVDSASGRENLGIYRLTVDFNGRKVLDYKCDILVFSNGRLNVGGRGFDDIFDRKGYYKIEGLVYAEGKNEFRISASDYAGNQTVKEYEFNIKLDMDK